MPRLIDANVAEKNWWQELRTNYADDYGKGFQAGQGQDRRLLQVRTGISEKVIIK